MTEQDDLDGGVQPMSSRLFSASDQRRTDKAAVILLSIAFGVVTAVGGILLGYVLPSSTLNTTFVHHDLGDIAGWTILYAFPGFVSMAAVLATAYILFLRSRPLLSSLTILSLAAMSAQGITGYSGYAFLTWCRCGPWFYYEHVAGEYLVDLWLFFAPGIVAALVAAFAMAGRSGRSDH
jgi:hypothetical protein